MKIDNFDILGSVRTPNEANAPLSVDADAALFDRPPTLPGDYPVEIEDLRGSLLAIKSERPSDLPVGIAEPAIFPPAVIPAMPYNVLVRGLIAPQSHPF
ncbi:hypothetical protein D3C85_817820 [compost metagenome]